MPRSFKNALLPQSQTPTHLSARLARGTSVGAALALKGWQHLHAQIDELDTEIARRVRALEEHAAAAQMQREAPAPGSVCVRAPK